MEIHKKILIIEDEKRICNFMRTILAANDYNVVTAENGKEALSMISSHCPDLVLLDLGLPDIEGLDILKELRTWSSMPVIVVSARSNEADKVTALDCGADDYLTKPFGTSELLARIRTALRHTITSASAEEVAKNGKFCVGDLMIDYNKYRVYINGKDANLTQSEFKIVALLGKNPGRVLTYDYIIKTLWGPAQKNDNRILRVNMANIRRKIEQNPAEPRYIFTEVGVGYRIAEPE